MRAGRQWTVHLHAFLRYWSSARFRFDVVLDEVNTMPFFSPLWARIPIFMLVFQLAREVWWYESPFPINAIGYVTEPLYLRAYRRTPAITISKSTKDDLRRVGLTARIDVIPIGIEPFTASPPRKEEVPTFLFVGRLAPSKRIDHVLVAFERFVSVSQSGALWIVGMGSDGYKRKLIGFATQLGIYDRVRFFGHVPTAEKYRLMGSAHALLMTSVREGWGLAVTEANSTGTPAIVYDVPGLRDSVEDGVTGLIVPPDPRNLADAMFKLMSDSELYSRLVQAAARSTSPRTYEGTANALEGAIVDAAHHARN